MEVDAEFELSRSAALTFCSLLASTSDRSGREGERQGGRNGSIGALLLDAVTEWGWLN